jgi:hypothetical protein
LNGTILAPAAQEIQRFSKKSNYPLSRLVNEHGYRDLEIQNQDSAPNMRDTGG